MFQYLLILLMVITISVAEKCERCGEKNIRWTGGNAIEWPSPDIRHIYQETGNFIRMHNLVTRVAIFQDNALVTIPRFKHGVPFTLGSLNLTSNDCEARLSPFPDWRLQEEGDCTALQSAVDLFLDSRDTLWILDVGVVNALENPFHHCPPKVIAVSARTGKIERSIDLSHLVTLESRLQYIVADYGSNGNLHLYIADAFKHILIVFDVTHTFGFRLRLPKFVASSCTICNVLFMALTKRPEGGKNLIISYLDGGDVFAVGTDFLQTVFPKSVEHIGNKPKDMVLLGMDDDSRIYYRLGENSDVYRVNLTYPLEFDSGQLVYDSADLLPATHVVPDRICGRMRVLQSNFKDYFKQTVRFGVKHSLRLI